MNHRLAALAVCLMSTTALRGGADPAAPAKPVAPTVPNNPDYTALQEGKPVDSRLNENVQRQAALSRTDPRPLSQDRALSS